MLSHPNIIGGNFMSNNNMKNPVIGKSVTGSDFFGRQNTIKLILKELEKTDILLQGARRFGKSSIMKEIQIHLQSQNTQCLYGDFESIKSETDFFKKMEEIIDSTNKWLRWKKKFIWIIPIISKIMSLKRFEMNEVKVEFEPTPTKKLNESDLIIIKENLFEKIPNSKPLVIIIDEFSIALSQMGKEEAKSIIHWISTVKEEKKNVKFIIGGSVSTTRLLTQLKEKSFLDRFSNHLIEGYTKQEAVQYIRHHLNNTSSQICNRICSQIGSPYVPIFLAVFIRQIQIRIENGEKLSVNLVDDVYEREMLGAIGKERFSAYADRLQEYDTKKNDLICAILNRLCRETNPIKVTVLHQYIEDIHGLIDPKSLSDLLYELEHEFYITLSGKKPDQTILFKSKLLKDWWREIYADE
jgi:hypothetical protein